VHLRHHNIIIIIIITRLLLAHDGVSMLVLVLAGPVVEIRYPGMKDVYKIESFRCQNSDTRLSRCAPASSPRHTAPTPAGGAPSGPAKPSTSTSINTPL
jgi:hypothetical protein